MSDPVWLNTRQAAARAQVGPRIIWRAHRRGALKGAKVNIRGDLRFKPEWVDAWLEALATGPSASADSPQAAIRRVS
jgi:hypothetical protein